MRSAESGNGANTKRFVFEPRQHRFGDSTCIAYFGTYTVDEAAKTVTYHIERATFPQWDGINRTANIAIATENELNQISAPVQDPSLGTVIPHLNFKRAM